MFSEIERQEILQLFGAFPEHLDAESFRKSLRELRIKYHPDNFEKYGDETVRQLATDRFQRIENYAEKLENLFKGERSLAPVEKPNTANPIFHPKARFASNELKIEIRTADKDLKYHLFGAFYRWLKMGDKFKIPNTKAELITDEDHLGRSIGFTESIRLWLTFNEADTPEAIIGWLFERIEGRADSLLIENELIPIAYEAMLVALKQRSFKGLPADVP